MFEHKSQKILNPGLFALRVALHFALALACVAVALGFGILGYHYLARLGWLDSLLNASMILGGMGQVDLVTTREGKIFASFYALFSGLFFIGVASVVLVPFVHRILHQLHMDD